MAALAALALAYAFMGQTPQAGQTTNYALVKSLADGTAIIDRTRFEVGDRLATDISYFDGHWYANKAPGLAFVALPAYLVFEAAGGPTTGDPTRALWALGLVGSVLPAILLLLVVRGLAGELAPGLGTLTAVTLGAGTLVLPWASIFYSHILAAALLMGAFALLWRSRRPFVAGPSGALAGYAITTEYSSAVAVLVLGIYVLVRARTELRAALVSGASFGAGVFLGVVPLLAYNWWAFGSPLHQSYEGTIGPPITDETVGFQTFHVGVRLLFGSWGLLQTFPVLAAAAVALVVLYRRGRRAEAFVCAAIPILYLGLNTILDLPFGGATGPRYLVPALPFLALPLALAYRARPLTTAALAAVSVSVAVVMQATDTAVAWRGGGVFERLFSANGSPQTVADFLGVTGWYAILPFYAAIVAAVVLAALSANLDLSRREGASAGAALLGWAVVAAAAPRLVGWQALDEYVSALAVLLLAGGAMIAALAISRRPAYVPGNSR